jgi:hypothetical protein
MGSGVKHLTLILVLAIVLLATASTALAGGSAVLTGHSSQPPAAQVLGVHGGTKSPSATVVARTLPFTGLDLGFVAGIGLVLAAAGVVLRRSGRQNRSSTP